MDIWMEALIALVFLAAMEIVLGIDNIVFITILTGRLPKESQPKARKLGLALALISRLALLAALSYVQQADSPLFHLTDLGVRESWLEHIIPFDPPHAEMEHSDEDSSERLAEAMQTLGEQQHAEVIEEINGISLRDLVLLLGGLFLIAKSVFEIHERMNEHEGSTEQATTKRISFTGVLIQIALLDIVFSLDSVITAVGMADELWIMATAVVIAVAVMLIFAEVVSQFVEDNPTLKMLALSFLILIGLMLVTEGIGAGINKGYIYFAMAFALIVEFLNLRVRRNSKH